MNLTGPVPFDAHTKDSCMQPPGTSQMDSIRQGIPAQLPVPSLAQLLQTATGNQSASTDLGFIWNQFSEEAGNPETCTDPEKCKLIQQQLVFLLHARQCPQGESQGINEIRCPLPLCNAMKKVLNHMEICLAGKSCTVPNCSYIRLIITHWNHCVRNVCPICTPLKPGVSNTSVPFINMQQNASNVHQLFDASTVKETQTQQGAAGSDGQIQLLTSLQRGQVSSSYVQCTKEWHRSVTPHLRAHLVHKLVQALFSTPDHRDMHNLMAYAREVECDMYKMANSRSEYYRLVAEKIYIIQKELEEKRKQEEQPQLQSAINALTDLSISVINQTAAHEEVNQISSSLSNEIEAKFGAMKLESETAMDTEQGDDDKVTSTEGKDIKIEIKQEMNTDTPGKTKVKEEDMHIEHKLKQQKLRQRLQQTQLLRSRMPAIIPGIALGGYRPPIIPGGSTPVEQECQCYHGEVGQGARYASTLQMQLHMAQYAICALHSRTPTNPRNTMMHRQGLHQLKETLRTPQSPDQQQHILQILKSNPQLMAAFIRQRQKAQAQPRCCHRGGRRSMAGNIEHIISRPNPPRSSSSTPKPKANADHVETSKDHETK